jgi:hypothetical protein
MEKVEEKYNSLCCSPSDINEHLPVLYKYAKECKSVLECGVRGCVSSWALVFGLLHNNSETKNILLNDKVECDINELLNETKDLSINIKYEWINNLDLNVNENYDLVFIDTWHIYGHLKRELNKFGPVTNKYIIMHDTTIDEIDGETIRCGWNAEQQSQETGYSVDEIRCGLSKAISEFLENNKDWELLEKLTNNNGLTILKKQSL